LNLGFELEESIVNNFTILNESACSAELNNAEGMPKCLEL
jgi:hypothetical protein